MQEKAPKGISFSTWLQHFFMATKKDIAPV